MFSSCQGLEFFNKCASGAGKKDPLRATDGSYITKCHSASALPDNNLDVIAMPDVALTGKIRQNTGLSFLLLTAHA